MKKGKRGRPPRTRMPDGTVKIGFDHETITLRIDEIAPLKAVSPAVRNSEKFKQIQASMRQVGIIEQPIVAAAKVAGKYVLLDGHLRLEALKDMGVEEVVCLISTDDESFTYNKHINRISTVQEHRMIQKAVKRGVSEEKIAQALNINVGSIVKRKNLIEGICPEAIDLLKDKMVAIVVFSILRQMKPYRQIEVASLMNGSNTHSISYAKALLFATPKDQLMDPDKPKNIRGYNEEQIARMESEMGSLHRELKLIEENYGKDVLTLNLAEFKHVHILAMRRYHLKQIYAQKVSFDSFCEAQRLLDCMPVELTDEEIKAHQKKFKHLFKDLEEKKDPAANKAQGLKVSGVRKSA